MRSEETATACKHIYQKLKSNSNANTRLTPLLDSQDALCHVIYVRKLPILYLSASQLKIFTRSNSQVSLFRLHLSPA